MARRKKHPGGRPSRGITDAGLGIRLPQSLLDASKAAAAAEGCTLAEWWRRAAAARLDATHGPRGWGQASAVSTTSVT